jgi:hypothetical protein
MGLCKLKVQIKDMAQRFRQIEGERSCGEKKKREEENLFMKF